MTRQQAIKAVHEACKKTGCSLVNYDFKDGDMTIVLTRPDSDRAAQVGREENYAQYGYDELKLRVARFASHFVNQKPYYYNQPFGSIS